MKKLLLIGFCVVSVLATRAVEVVSTRFATEVTAAGASSAPLFSADGRHIIFMSHARNLVTNGTDGIALNIFSHDLVSVTTRLVSCDSAGHGSRADCLWPAVSSNGQFIAFSTVASSVLAMDTNGWPDIFVRDFFGGSNAMVTLDIAGEPLGGSTSNLFWSSAPLLSADGRWVFFESRMTNLVAGTDTNLVADVFRRDLHSNVTELVSHRWSSPSITPRLASTLTSITPDGRRATFLSKAHDEVVSGAGNTNGADAYVRDMSLNAVVCASPLAPWYVVRGWYDCKAAILSENGRYVLVAANLMDGLNPASYAAGAGSLFRYDLDTSATIVVASNALIGTGPQISATGRYVVFEDGTNVYRWDDQTGSAELVNVSTNGVVPIAGGARKARMTPDGNGIVFIANCPDLTTNSIGTNHHVYARNMSSGEMWLVSVDSSGQPSVESHEHAMLDVSRDFRYVAFASSAGDLVVGDSNRAEDVFVRDLVAGTTSVISKRDPATAPRRTGLGHAFINPSCVSSNGEVVAFGSFDTDLVAGDTNQMADPFIAHLNSGVVISPDLGTNALRTLALSANGRYLFIVRRVSINSSAELIFRSDLQEGTNEFVGTNAGYWGVLLGGSSDGNAFTFRSGGYTPGFTIYNVSGRTNEFTTNGTTSVLTSGEQWDAIFTPDDRFVVFSLNSTLHAWDRLNRQVQVIAPQGPLAVSGNSRFVAIAGVNFVTRWDLLLRTSQTFSSVRGTNVSISADGRFIAAFEEVERRIVILDCNTGQVTPASFPGMGGSLKNSRTSAPVISPNARFVAFLVETLKDDGLNSHCQFSQRQVAVRDRLLGTTTLVGPSPTLTAADYQCGRPFFSADGHKLVFHSSAGNLAAGDYNDRGDIFVLILQGADNDADGMDDEWEVAYFNSLSRNGLGDWDNDGVSDKDEFLAGTDPTNTDSVFRVLSLARAGQGGKQLIWTGNPARNYQVEYKDSLEAAAWTSLDLPVTWNGSTAAVTDSDNTTNRFYRVVRQ